MQQITRPASSSCTRMRLTARVRVTCASLTLTPPSAQQRAFLRLQPGTDCQQARPPGSSFVHVRFAECRQSTTCFVPKPLGRCGNGILEPATGEQCDAGQTRLIGRCVSLIQASTATRAATWTARSRPAPPAVTVCAAVVRVSTHRSSQPAVLLELPGHPRQRSSRGMAARCRPGAFMRAVLPGDPVRHAVPRQHAVRPVVVRLPGHHTGVQHDSLNDADRYCITAACRVAMRQPGLVCAQQRSVRTMCAVLRPLRRHLLPMHGWPRRPSPVESHSKQGSAQCAVCCTDNKHAAPVCPVGYSWQTRTNTDTSQQLTACFSDVRRLLNATIRLTTLQSDSTFNKHTTYFSGHPFDSKCRSAAEVSHIEA